MDRIITMTGWRRPEYTKQVLDSLQQCIGFEDYTLLPTLEPGYPKVIKLFDNIPNCEVVVNNNRLGCATNTFNALSRGFERSNFIIHLEDDTAPAVDMLKYFEYINHRYKDDKQIFTASAYNRVNRINHENMFSVSACPYFTGWGWATWKDRFEEMSGSWDYVDKYGWDNNINQNIRCDRLEITPNLPRSKNIGQYNGTYATPILWREQQYSPVWANDYSLEIQKTLYEYKMLSKLSSSPLSEYPYFETEATSCPGDYNKIGILLIGSGILGYLYLKSRKVKITTSNSRAKSKDL